MSDHGSPRSMDLRAWRVSITPLRPWSAHPTFTVEILLGSTAMDSVEPIRSCPSAGAFDHGIETPLITSRPGKLSDGSFNAWKGFGPVAPVSSRTTTTRLLAVLPSHLRRPKNAWYTVSY